MSKFTRKYMFDSRGCIFDFDGTLVDSMGIWEDIGKRFAIEFSLGEIQDFTHILARKGIVEGARALVSRHSLKVDPEFLVKKWKKSNEFEYRRNVYFKPGALEFLQKLKEQSIPLSIATAGQRKPLELALHHLGAVDLFDSIIVCEEIIDSGKTTPAGYIAAAKEMGILPEECAVFEDVADNAFVAKRAGFFVCGVKDDHLQQNEEELKRICNKWVDSFYDLL